MRQSEPPSLDPQCRSECFFKFNSLTTLRNLVERPISQFLDSPEDFYESCGTANSTLWNRTFLDSPEYFDGSCGADDSTLWNRMFLDSPEYFDESCGADDSTLWN